MRNSTDTRRLLYCLCSVARGYKYQSSSHGEVDAENTRSEIGISTDIGEEIYEIIFTKYIF